MNKIDLRSTTQLLTLLIFALFSTSLLINEMGATALGQEAIGQASSGLFTPVEGVQGAQVVPPQADKRVVIERSRAVQLNWEHLPSIDRISAALLPTMANDQLQLNLFADLTLTALLNQIETNPSGGGYVWSGAVEGVPNSLVQLVVKEQLMAGDIRLPDRQGAEGLIAGAIYQVRPTTDGLYTVRQLRMVAPLPSAQDYARPLIERPTAALTEAGNVAGAQTDDDSTIDVMVAYTPLVRNTVGGAAALAMEIDLAVSLTNQAYSNSGIKQRLRLVHTVEVNYTEIGQWTDLNRMTSKNDGFLDELHTLRDQVGADIVSLLLKTDEDSSGVGWLLEPVEPDFESHAFNVVDICCATGGLVFAHELGHNMGAAHDWYVDDEPGAFTYSHGYVEPGCGFKTIMAYGSECSWFNPIANFSNPDIQHAGKVTGVRAGTNLGCRAGNRNNPPCDADNRLTFNNTALTVANFRQSVDSPAPTSTPVPTDPSPPPTAAPPTNTPVNPATATNTPVSTPVPTVPSGRTPTPFPTCTPVPTTIPTSPPEATPSLEITSDATIGAPGSHFMIEGRHFPLNTTLTLSVNARQLANILTDGNGSFVVLLVTRPTTGAGVYRLSAGSAYDAFVTFTIDPDAPLIEVQVSGQSIVLPLDLQPQTQLYLPLIQRAGGGASTSAMGGVNPCT